MQDLTHLILSSPPPLDPAWIAYESAAGLLKPKPTLSAVERQPIYASECRARNAAMMEPGARDYDLSQGIRISSLTVPNQRDGYAIPLLRYEVDRDATNDLPKARDDVQERGEEIVIFYIHGGGLLVGETDSEELTCRRLVKHFPRGTSPSAETSVQHTVKLYSIGYRLMPQVPVQTCFEDVMSAFNKIEQLHKANNARFVLVGSSSGGELAAFLSQFSKRGSFAGVLLRCPVTVDAPAHIPVQYKDWHTSADPAFITSLLGLFKRQLPRDGFAKMPLEASPEFIRGLRLPRTWIQVCTNDVLYSDGVCYAKLLQDGGVEVQVDVVQGWPHTFWLKAPHLDRALEADNKLLRGVAWVLGQ